MVSWYGAQVLTHVEHFIYYGVMLIRELSDKGPKGPGDGILVSVVTQLGVTRPCVGRDLVWFSGTSFQRRSHVAMGSSLA